MPNGCFGQYLQKGPKHKTRTSVSNFKQSNYSEFQISASTHNFDFLKQIAIKRSTVEK